MESPLPPLPKGWERWLRRIFTRPWLAALLVGFAIHGFNALNQWLAGAGSYLESRWLAIWMEPVFGFGQVLIPFLVPWLVTSVGRHLAGLNRAAVLAAFPDANPDVIIKLDSDGSPIYANRAARRWLRDMGEPETAITKLLPEDYCSRLKHEGPDAVSFTLPFSRAGREVEYLFRRERVGGGIFVAGRDVSSQRDKAHRLETTQRRFRRLVEIVDGTLSHFDPLSFDRYDHYRRILGTLLRDPRCGPRDKPTHVFLAERRGDALEGYIYTCSDAEVIKDPEKIVILPNEPSYAITWGAPQVIAANWRDSGESLTRFQWRFHPCVREKIGEIEGFATYQSGDVAIIAFYRDYTVDHSDAMILKGMAVFGNSLHRVAKATQETEDAFIYTVEALARAAEANDEDTGNHIVRINEYSKLLAQTLGMDETFVKHIYYSAQMHDVGKIHVPPDILKKPGRLTEEQFEAMKTHPLYGAQILGESKRLRMAAEIALYHHEKYNGTGYPHGMSGEEIPISARIVALADVYDALRQARSYKPALGHERAVEIICYGDGRTDPGDFDPTVLDAFVRVADRMDAIFSASAPVVAMRQTG